MATTKPRSRRPGWAGRRAWVLLAAAASVLHGGCGSENKPIGEPHHVGGKVNTADLSKNPAAYRGKALTLKLQVAEPLDAAKGETLQSCVGKVAKFTCDGTGGVRFEILIRLPDGLKVPAVGLGSDVFVNFVCTRGRLREGNDARAVDLP